MNNCKMCGGWIPEGADECPNCGFKTGSMKNINSMTKGIKIFMGVFIVLFVAVFILGIVMFLLVGGNRFNIFGRGFGITEKTVDPYNEYSNKADEIYSDINKINDEKKKAEKNIVDLVRNIELAEEPKIVFDKFYFVEVKLRNNNDQAVRFVEVTYDIYDNKGSLLKSEWNMAQSIEAKGIWDLRVNCGFSEPDNIVIKKIEILVN